MTKEELAGKLDGGQYGHEIPKYLDDAAKSDGLVVVFGASDSLMEFRGAIHNEANVYEEEIVPIYNNAVIENQCDAEDCPYFAALFLGASKIEAVWDEEGYSWIYKTDIPHATFEIMEYGDKYCRGIVFSIGDVK